MVGIIEMDAGCGVKQIYSISDDRIQEFYNCQIKENMGRKLLKKGETPDKYQTQLYDRITKIQAQVLERIQKLKSGSRSFLCEHFSMNSSNCQPYDPTVNYYDRFWKRFLLNEIGKQNLHQFKDQLETFTRKLSKIDLLFNQWEKQLQPIAAARRRTPSSPQLHQFVCNVCSKSYRDEEALMLHAKIKHKNIEEQQPILKFQREEMEIFQEEENQDE